jgi:Bacterial Ig-like domain/Divergent InlB B-repeat domain
MRIQVGIRHALKIGFAVGAVLSGTSSALAQGGVVSLANAHVQLVADGTCTDVQPSTRFDMTGVEFNGLTADYVNGDIMRDFIGHVLVDSQNRRVGNLGGRNVDVGTTTSASEAYFISETPVAGPLSVLYLDSTNTVFYALGAVVTETPVATYKFDAGARDPDCPTAPTDITPPLVTSMELLNNPDNTATTITYRVVFNEPAFNVSIDDFDLRHGDDTTVTVTNLTAISASEYEATLSISGADTVIYFHMPPFTDIADAAGNTGPDQYGRIEDRFFFDVTPPAITSIERLTPAAAVTSADSVTWRVRFNETVLNVTSDDFIVSGTTGTVTVDNVSAVNADVTVSGGDLDTLTGDITLSLAPGQDIVDFTGGFPLPLAGPTGTDESTYTLDNSGPRVSSIERQSPTTYRTIATSLTWRFTFDEPVVNVTLDDFDFSGDPTATTSINIVSDTITDVTMTGGDLATFPNRVIGVSAANDNDFADTLGNAMSNVNVVGTNDNEFLIDHIDPQAILTSAPAAVGSTAVFQIEVTFTEDVSGLDAGDFSITNGSVSAITGGPSVYTISITPDGNGDMDIVLAANAVVDGTLVNTNVEAPFGTVGFDTVPPTLNMYAAGAGSPFTGPREITLAFSEAVFGFTVDDIVAVGATLSGFRANPGDRFYFVTVNRIADGPFTLDVAEGAAVDVVGLPNVAATQYSASFDTVPPTVVLSTAAAEPVNDTFTINIEFSEDITGLNEGDFTVVNGSTNNITGSGASYTMEIRPTVFTAGTLTVDLRADTVQDAAEFGNAASNQLSLAYDRESPTLVSILRQSPLDAAIGLPDTQVVFRATFSEDVVNVDVADWAIQQGGGGTIDSVTPVSASVYDIAYTLLNASHIIEMGITRSGDVSIQDSAGNPLYNEEATGTTETYLRDTSPPYVTNVEFVTTGGSPTASDTLMWAVTFSEDMTNASAGDFALTGTTAAVTAVSTPQSTVVVVTASGGDLADVDGFVTLGLDAGSDLSDIVGNPVANLTVSFGGTDERTVRVDNGQPVLTISATPGPVSGPFGAFFDFSEETTDFELNDISVTNGAASDLIAQSSTRFVATITPDRSGNLTIDVAAGAALDNVGNASLAAPQATILYDLTPPTATISGPAGPVSGPFSVSIAFSEEIVGLEAGDVVVANGSVTSFLPPLGGKGGDQSVQQVGQMGGSPSYSVTITPAANGAVLVDLPGAVAQDQAGNDNLAASQFSVVNDETAPTLAAITRSSPTASVTNADSLTWTVGFSEDVTAIDAGDFAVSGTTGTVTGVSPQAVALPPSVAGDGISAPFAVSSSMFLVTVSGGDLASYSGSVALSFAGAQNITDLAGNALTNTTPTGTNEANFTVDNEAPTLVLTATETSPVSGPFLLTMTFSEDVTGFEPADLIVDNATLSGFHSANARLHTVTLTPGPGPAVTVDVTAGAASDAAGNDNLAASQFSIANNTTRMLTVTLPGVGNGNVSSTPGGIDCGADCTEAITVGASVTLTAAAEAGSSFASWTSGPCQGSAVTTCDVTLVANQIIAARFTLDNPPAGRIVASTLPGARSGYVGGPQLTAFLSVVSRATTPAQSCRVTAPGDAPFTLTYLLLDDAGEITGGANPLFDIAQGQALSFLLAMELTAQTGAGGYDYLPMIECENASLDPILGVNSVLLNIGATPTPDILSIASTPSADGVIRIPNPGAVGLMTAAAVNIGAGDGSGAANEVTLTVSADSGAAALPVTIEICQIDSVTAACLAPRAADVTLTMTGSDPVFFAVFVRDTSTGGIAFNPANSRIFLRFADATGTIRSATSAAVTAPAPAAAPEIASSLPTGRWSVLMRQPDGIWPGLVRAAIHVMADGRVLVDDGIAPRLVSIEPVTADNETGGRFAVHGSTGLWTTSGTIRLGGPWAEQTGEFWGVRDSRSEALTNWQDLSGNFGDNLFLSETGEIRGTIGGCGVYGQATGLATRAVSLSLSGCARSGAYLGMMDLPANDNGRLALLIANGSNGWRVER